MKLNLNPIRHIFRINGMRIGCFILFFVIFGYSTSNAQIKNEDEIKKQAEKFLEDEEYSKAYKLYAELVSYYPKDPELNFRLGVCMIYTEPDKKKPFFFLKIAAASKDAPKDLKFYLAKTYHINYQFDEAIKLYTEYKLIGSSSSIKKLQVDREIEACKNGKRLLANISDLVVINKKQLNEADYFRSYDLKDIGGKLLVKPDEFRTSNDKKKKEKSVIYLPRNGERIYYSSYGENGNRGRDIFFVNKLPNGSWSKPQSMPVLINTEYDEDYPFLHPNGKTLYFSSKGHNSMGGFDVFKTTFDDETQSWGKPLNLDFPINSPDDDILFVTDSLEKTAFFSTGRYSPFGKIDVLKINTERRPMNFAVLKGTVLKEEVSQSLKAKITVKNIENGETVGTYLAQDNGDYSMEIPNGGKFIFTVEIPGLTTQSEGVTIPIAYSLKPYKQVISYDKKILKIINYFDGQIADENYSMMLDLIEKKAKLEMNENEPYNNGLKDQVKNNVNTNDNANLKAVNTNNPTITNETNTSKTNTNKNITNEQLLEMSKTDAKEASDESIKLKKEAEDAFGLATQKTAEAVAIQKEADDLLTHANTLTDIAKKNEELSKVNELKEDAKVATNVANTATNLAKKLEADAIIQQQEADLTNQYIKEIEAVTKNKNNKEALTKLENIQKQLEDLSKQKNQSDELYTSLKAESELKQTELKKSVNKSNDITNEINNINTEAKNLEKDLVNETDNSIKDNIKAQIKELTNEIELKNKDLETNNQKISVLKNEVDGVNKEIEIAAKILNEKTDVITSNYDNTDKTEGAVITNTLASNNETVTSIDNSNYEKITSKYKNEITSNATTKDDLSIQNDFINNYNNDASNLISKDKNELSSTKDQDKKKKLNEEIKQLEKTIISNNQLLAINTNKIKQLETKALASNTIASIEASSTSSNTTSDNITSTNIIANETSSVVSNSINNSSSLSNVNELQKEADDLDNTAYKQRKEASTKTGSEKEALIKQATDNEKLATTKKIQVSEITQTQSKETFDKTNNEVSELKKIIGTKSTPEITEAYKLIDEANVAFTQAQKIRQEANTNPNNAAKLGGYSNAEEKENEALLKQKKAINLLNKENSIVAINNSDNNLTKKDSANTKNTELLKQQQKQIDDLLIQSNANQNNIKLKEEQLISKSDFNNPTNKTAQDLKLKADALKNDASDIVTLQSTMNELTEKITLLEQANSKEKEALQLINESFDILSKNAITSTNTNTTNIVINENNSAVNNNTITSSSSSQTIANTDNNSVNETNISVTNTNTVTNTINESKYQEPITSLLNEADKLNNEASILRKSSSSKTGLEKDKDLNEAKSLEKQAITKKVEAADKQKLLNAATYDANKQSLIDLAAMAKGKNISELNSIDVSLNEADLLLKQANSLRTETNNYPTDAAKLGGYSNAEEKEALALQKQKAVLTIYQKYFSNYSLKEPNLSIENINNTTNTVVETDTQKRIDSLDVLIKSNNAIYKSRFLSLNPSLNSTQTDLKAKAQAAYKKNQELVFASSQVTDLTSKKNTLIEANINVTNAINLLTKINENALTATNTNTTINIQSKIVSIKKEELTVTNTNAYTNAKPIPIDEKIPDGLIYKVQIGAFKSALPNNTFKGLSPVTGQTTASGLIRYMAGSFGQFENANAVKNDLNKLGYTDAFVVAYYNGVRVNLNEVLNNAKKAGQTISEVNNTDSSAGLTKNSNVATNNVIPNISNNNNNTTINNTNTSVNESVVITSELEKLNGLLFTVQIGVYSKQVARSQLLNLKPIYTEQLPNGLYRYTAGIYNQADKIVTDKRKVVDLGVKDAFITAYYNAKKIPFNDGKKLQIENSNLKMEVQNPIIFNENNTALNIDNLAASVITPSINPTNDNPITTSSVNVVAFSNGVTSGPTPTAENGVKTDDVGISYKVQVGAYRYQVPNDVASKFLSIKNWPVNTLVINGLYIYTFGNFNGVTFAKKLRDEAISFGITDAFVTVYKDGKKLYGAEATQYLNK